MEYTSNDWFKVNKLIVNCEKTNLIYFTRKNNLHDPTNVNIMMNGTQLNLSKHVKFLGIILDDQINFNKQRSQLDA